VEKRVGVLSGGERSRLVLAKLVMSKANLLMLDEPTNHLDMSSREVLENALMDFPGTLLFASHDRYFIDKLATHLWLWQDGTIHVFKGSYSRYRTKMQSGEDIVFEEELPSFGLRKAPPSRRTYGAFEGKSSKERKKLPGSRIKKEALDNREERVRRELDELESRIEGFEMRRQELVDIFEDPSAYNDPQALPWKEYDEIKKVLSELYVKWEKLAGVMEKQKPPRDG